MKRIRCHLIIHSWGELDDLPNDTDRTPGISEIFAGAEPLSFNNCRKTIEHSDSFFMVGFEQTKSKPSVHCDIFEFVSSEQRLHDIYCIRHLSFQSTIFRDCFTKIRFSYYFPDFLIIKIIISSQARSFDFVLCQFSSSKRIIGMT